MGLCSIFGLMAELQSPGAATSRLSLTAAKKRKKLEEDHVGIPAPHHAMKCQGKRHSVRGVSEMSIGVLVHEARHNSNIFVQSAVTRSTVAPC